MERIADEVRDGKLDFALTKPQDSQLIVYIRQLNIWQAVDVVSGAIVIGVGVSRLRQSPGVGHTLAFLALLALGALLLYCFWLVLATGTQVVAEAATPRRHERIVT